MSKFEKEAQDLKNYLIETLKTLISIKSVNYNIEDYPENGPDGMESPGEEFRVADFVKSELDKTGVKYKIAGTKKRPDVYAFIGKGDESKKSLIVAAHMDTVPSGSTPWTKSEPFSPVEEDGKIYGRGAEDNKGQLASLLAAAKILKDHKSEISGQIILAAVSDEEVNMCPSMTKSIENGEIKVTDSIIPDVGGSMKKITIAEKGRLVLTVKAIGKGAHASKPKLGENAIEAMARFLSLLSNYQLKHENDDLFPDGPTVNVGLIKGGDAENQVAGACEATLDIRYLPSQSPNDIVEELLKLSEDASGKFDINIRQNMDPVQVPRNAAIIKLIQKYSYAEPIGIGGGTVSRILVANGINSVGWSPGDEDLAHAPDECVEIDQMVKFTQLICEIGIDLVNQDK